MVSYLVSGYYSLVIRGAEHGAPFPRVQGQLLVIVWAFWSMVSADVQTDRREGEFRPTGPVVGSQCGHCMALASGISVRTATWFLLECY